jgi:hypothetical protein
MAYNHIYNLQFKGLDQVGTDLYYQVKFEKQEATVEPYDVIELIPAQDSAFVLNYKANKDNIFAPIRASYADIKCFIPYDSTVQPSDFFFDSDEYTFKVSLYETNGVTETLKWVGFLLPDVIQYEWQEQYYLQLTATDNIAVLKDIKYTREDYYALYNDTSVDTCIDVNDFVCRLLKKTGSELDVAFYSQFKIDSTLVNLANLKLSEYSSVDWATFEPKDCYFLLGTLMESLGCVVYQSNKDATWYVVAINDLAVNDLVKDGTFSVNGALPPLYQYWTTNGDVLNNTTDGLNGSQCPQIFGDNTSYVRQTIPFQIALYTISFWAKNFENTFPNAVVRVNIDGVGDVFTTTATNEWVYYEFEYNRLTIGSPRVYFYNNNDDSTGYLLIDNISIKQKFQNGLKYDIDGTYISEYTFDFYSSIGNSGNVKWSDVNQVVTLNKRLTNVQFNYPYYERNLINNYGFFKDYATTTTTPTNWQLESPFDFANATGDDRPFDNRILSVIENEDITGGLNTDIYLYNTFRLTNNISPFGFYNFFAIKVECSVYFDDSHTDGDGINIAFVKSKDGTPSTSNTRYLDSTGTYYSVVTSALWNAVFRMPIFMSDKSRWMKYKCLSKFDQNSLADGTTLYEFGTLVLRPQRSFDTANVHQTYFDDIKVSIIPQGYKNTKGFIYNATNIPNDATMVKPFSNTYKIDKGQYHGGIANKSESQIIEDFIGYDTGGELNLIQNSNRWLRPWETASELILGRPMQECITRSILSFYQATWQKFTGNVYGKDISFGQVFNIALAQGLHFMHEASFDYVSNKTNITTHQSQTDKLETGFRSWSTTKDDTGAGQGEPGSTTSSIQESGE